MRRIPKLGAILVTFALFAAACGGGSPAPEGEGAGISAIDEAQGKKDGERGGAGDNRASRKNDEKNGKRTSSDEAKAKKDRPAANAPAADDETKESGAGGRSAKPESDSRPTRGSSRARPASPIPTGRYDYATDGHRTISGNREDLPDTTTLAVEAPANAKQTQIRDLRDEEGNGSVVETRLLYRSDGVFLTYVKVTSSFEGGLTDVRELRPRGPELIAPTDGGPGFTRSFSMQGSGTRAEVAVAALRYENVNVGGTTLKSLVVRTDIVFSGSLEGKQRSTSWFWPRHVLMVKEDVRTDVSNGPIRLRSDYVALLKRLPG